MQVKVIEDSYNPVAGRRLTTFELVIPRYILPQLLTHRQFSRNAQSSRAMPIKRMVDQVKTNPVTPIHWGKYQPGMQAYEELSGIRLKLAKLIWRKAGEAACLCVSALDRLGLAKQIANRILEPWAHVRVVLSATEWDNFFKLRCAPDAQHEIQQLANLIKESLRTSRPVKRYLPTDIHAPYVSTEEIVKEGLTRWEIMHISAARCARVSYDRMGKGKDIKADISLGQRLLEDGHLSPWEHVAVPAEFLDKKETANYTGWVQARHLTEQERAMA